MLTVILVVVLLALYGLLAMTAALSKSPTYDEPLHAISGWLQIHEKDFRVDPEDPPLWKYWAALLSRREDVVVDLELPPGTPVPQTDAAEPVRIDPRDPHAVALRYRLVAEDIYHEWPFTVEALYPCGRSLPPDSDRCPDTDAFIQRMRAMMLVLAIAGGAVLALWGWQLGGGIAAVAACFLYCLDPNFLGHGPLVKNDVPLTLIAIGLFMAVWRAGRRVTVWNTLAVGLLCAAAVTTKFSGLLFGPMVALLLIGRALVPQPWETFWRTMEKRWERTVLAAVILLVAFAISYVGLWAAYAFRFGPSSDPQIRADLNRMTVYASMAELTLQHGRPPTQAEAEAWRPSLMTLTILTLNNMRALPQAWLNGLLYTYQSALMRETYLLGEYSLTGWWYYFPVAMLAKTPLATLLAAAAALVLLGALVKRFGWRATLINWTAACLFLPPALFLASAMRSNLNLGLRHVLPVYPFIYLGIGLAAAAAWQHWRTLARRVAAVLALALALETLIAFPNYIAFFNLAAGGSRGGLDILSDSNLDWGQDLKLLAEWQRDNPDENLYLVYFGLADPWAYGIEYVNFPGGYPFGPRYEPRSDPGVLAISATALQGVYLRPGKFPGLREDYARLRQAEPLAVLGGTIHLYRWPPPLPRRER